MANVTFALWWLGTRRRCGAAWHWTILIQRTTTRRRPTRTSPHASTLGASAGVRMCLPGYSFCCMELVRTVPTGARGGVATSLGTADNAEMLDSAMLDFKTPKLI